MSVRTAGNRIALEHSVVQFVERNMTIATASIATIQLVWGSVAAAYVADLLIHPPSFNTVH
jgi:hypothetical protein